MNKQLAYPNTVKDLVAEYLAKSEALPANLRLIESQIEALNANTVVTVGRTTTLMSNVNVPGLSVAERHLRASAWLAIYKALNLDKVMSAKDKKQFEHSLTDPAELTLDNLQATFGAYWENPRHYILQGLTEVFISLDKFYKSHDNFGFGVKGLPKRAILSSFKGWGSWGFERLHDMCQAMEQAAPSAWLGEYVPEDERRPWRDIIRENSHPWRVSPPFKIEQLGLEVRSFQNGNAHVHFNKRALELINDCLHEFYGHVVPDDVAAPEHKQASTAVSKDLQFYPTPRSVIERVLDEAHLPKGSRCLEPSCGEGNIMHALRSRGFAVTGIEYHAGRAAVCRENGFAVQVGNFLDLPPVDEYDAVVMNPPFSGTHWAKHVQHAIKWLKPHGRIVAILPATAEGSDLLPKGGSWTDLPLGSFRESGTNVCVGYWTWRKP